MFGDFLVFISFLLCISQYFIFFKLNKYFVGETPNIQNRLQQHNNHYYKTNFIKNACDWVLKLSYKCENKQKAVFFEKIISNPNILTGIQIGI